MKPDNSSNSSRQWTFLVHMFCGYCEVIKKWCYGIYLVKIVNISCSNVIGLDYVEPLFNWFFTVRHRDCLPAAGVCSCRLPAAFHRLPAVERVSESAVGSDLQPAVFLHDPVRHGRVRPGQRIRSLVVPDQFGAGTDVRRGHFADQYRRRCLPVRQLRFKCCGLRQWGCRCDVFTHAAATAAPAPVVFPESVESCRWTAVGTDHRSPFKLALKLPTVTLVFVDINHWEGEYLECFYWSSFGDFADLWCTLLIFEIWRKLNSENKWQCLLNTNH